MQWALINTTDTESWMWVDNVCTLVNCVAGTIINIIDYNGSDPYTIPTGMKLEQVPDSAVIGDTGY
jgi:hypothetical protein